MSTWAVLTDQGGPGELHERSASRLVVPVPAAQAGSRLAVVHKFQAPGLVLGSTQPAEVADAVACRAAGVEVARRRSGGGAVLVEPGAILWVDLLVRRDDALWDDDVGRAAWWVGEAWCAALAQVGLSGEAWRGGLQRRPWSSLVCFAGLGAGEVTVNGRKVVGVSQRRSRFGALFQTACLLHWQPEHLVRLLALTEAEAASCLRDVADVATGAGPSLGRALLDAFTSTLPD